MARDTARHLKAAGWLGGIRSVGMPEKLVSSTGALAADYEQTLESLRLEIGVPRRTRKARNWHFGIFAGSNVGGKAGPTAGRAEAK